MASRNYKDLIAWQRAMELVVMCYRFTKAFPREEIYALTSQIRRAAVSVPSNIAEGEGRHNKNELARFLHIAHGSLRELETQVELSLRLTYTSKEDTTEFERLAAEVGKLINGLLRSLR